LIETERLLLRPWQKEDLKPFASLNADPRVMEFMPKVLTEAESDAMAEKIQENFAKDGFGYYAAVIKNTGEFIGYVGLKKVEFEAFFTPCVEIAWRLAFHAWGKGYCNEAAKAVLKEGFTKLGLKEIVSFTVPGNLRSRKVMERLGMVRDPKEDFHHPKLPLDHPLSLHVLYRLSKERWTNLWRKG
jgi:RimJ/RimL family protein N-acetyltransferase